MHVLLANAEIDSEQRRQRLQIISMKTRGKLRKMYKSSQSIVKTGEFKMKIRIADCFANQSMIATKLLAVKIGRHCFGSHYIMDTDIECLAVFDDSEPVIPADPS